MGRQRVNQSAVDFSQQMLITRHPAQLSVPVGFGFDAAFFPVQLKKSGIRRDDFCNHCAPCDTTPAVWAAVMVSQIYRISITEGFHQTSFILSTTGCHVIPWMTAVGTYQLNQTLTEQSDEQLRVCILA